MLGKLLFYILITIVAFFIFIILIIVIWYNIYLLSSIDSEIEKSKKDFIEKLIKKDKKRKRQLLHTCNVPPKEIDKLMLTLGIQYQKEENKFDTYCEENNEICKINYDASFWDGLTVSISYTFDKESTIFFNDGQYFKCKIVNSKQCDTYKLIYHVSNCDEGTYNCDESVRIDYLLTTITNNKSSTNIKLKPFIKEVLRNIPIIQDTTLFPIQEILNMSPFEKKIINYIKRSNHATLQPNHPHIKNHKSFSHPKIKREIQGTFG